MLQAMVPSLVPHAEEVSCREPGAAGSLFYNIPTWWVDWVSPYMYKNFRYINLGCVYIYVFTYIYIYVNPQKVEFSSFCLKHCKCIFSDFLMSDFSRLVKYYCLMTIAICIYYLLFTDYCCYIFAYIYIFIYIYAYLWVVGPDEDFE